MQLQPTLGLDGSSLSPGLGHPEAGEDGPEEPHEPGRGEQGRAHDLHREALGDGETGRSEAEDRNEDADDEESDGEEEHRPPDRLQGRPLGAKGGTGAAKEIGARQAAQRRRGPNGC